MGAIVVICVVLIVRIPFHYFVSQLNEVIHAVNVTKCSEIIYTQ